MEINDFVGYICDYKVHDSRIEKIINNDNEVIVLLHSEEETINVRFSGVHQVIEKDAEGMILYAICEMKGNEQCRRFVFANTDEEDEASLEVLAHEYYIE